MKKLISLLLAIVFLSGCYQEPYEGIAVSFESISKEPYSRYFEELYKEINNSDDFSTMWLQNSFGSSSNKPIPKVDFKQETVLAVFAGAKKTSGYSIQISRIEEQRDRLVVYVNQTESGKKCVVAETQSQPYHLVKIPKQPKKVKFVKIMSRKDC